ncbi:TPA: helix-turn-helix transcriptional regulator [Enterobacter kobei]|nr:helix-turn-helix transcriptional regulator [Enterobacter kobei]
MLTKKKEFVRDVFYNLIDYIDSRLPHPISIDELRIKSGYSKRHLSRLFMEHVGVSPSTYIKVMQTYRMLLELKFTTISVKEICEKYKKSNMRYFKKNIELTIGEDIDDLRVRHDIEFKKILREDKLIFPKRYLSCSFVSLFDYNLQFRGVKHTMQRLGENMMTSHYDEIEEIINDFCEAHSFLRDEVWMCAEFSPLDTDNYQVSLYTGIVGDPPRLPEGEALSLQGDYLCFSWVGHPEDTFSKIRSFYDIFFFQFMATRKAGYDIARRQKVEGISNYYIFTYYIPVAINEAILSIQTSD